MVNTNRNPEQSGLNPSVFDSLKWRRRGMDRRLSCCEASVEKRSTGDRRYHLLDLISKIIFPRLNDEK